MAAPAVTEIKITGRLSYEDYQDFHKMVTDIEGGSGHRVVFHISGLGSIDSAGLGMFMVAREMLDARAMTIQLKGAGGPVRKMMDLVKFGDAVPMVD